MTWQRLEAEKRVVLEPSSKEELMNLRSIVERSLKDANVIGLSSDTRFILAYDAARTLALMVVRAEGYRPKSHGGFHYNTFLALTAANADFIDLADYFDSCRGQRNHCEYDYAGGMTDTDADGLLDAAKDFHPRVESWLAEHHPELIRAPR